MTDKPDIPEWAKERAYALSYQGEVRFDDPDSFMISRVARAFALYIAAHEEPPVDPLLLEARGIASAACKARANPTGAQMCLDGKWDNEPLVRTALAALKRGMELAKEK